MNAARERWRDFIASSDHAGRFLSRIGGAVEGTLSDPVHMDELRSFLHALRGGESDERLLAYVVELLAMGHRHMVREDLPVLLDQLSSETARNEEIVGPSIRGSVRWMETRMARIAGRLPAGRYFSLTSRRSYDIPENRVVRNYLDALDAMATAVIGMSRPSKPPTTIVSLLDDVRTLQMHDSMRMLDIVEGTDEVDVSIAETSGRREYRRVAGLLRSLNRLQCPDDERRRHAMLMLLAVGWLEPIADDDVFELYVLVLVLDVLSVEAGLGQPGDVRLLRPKGEPIVGFDLDEGRVAVFFDTSLASVVGRPSRYKRAIDAHEGLTGHERRPDIVVASFDREGGLREVMIVEAKRSEDGRYLSDSVYKVFGYLHDFADFQADMTAILAVPEAVKRTGTAGLGEITVASGEDRDAFAGVLRAFVARQVVP